MGGNLRIGATVDVAEIKAGLDLTQEEIKKAAQNIPVAFEEAAGRTKAAMARISDEVKEQANVVSIEFARVAQATKAQAEAFADLRNATIVAKDAKVDDTTSTVLLASAQQKAAAASAELASAKQAEARAVAEAAEEESLSENVVIRAFQRAAIAISEASAEIREQLVETAEVGGLEAEGITAGFGGLSELLGAGIAAGFAAEYIDGLAKMNVELDHLAAKTGISISELAGLQQILKEAGGDFETVATGLVRMESNTEKLSQGNKQIAEAFTNLGLKIEDVRKAKPDELLQMIAIGMNNTADANIRANSAIAIFGRGGQELIPILREQGSQLQENMKRTGELTGITDDSAEAARRWTADVARLSAQFRAVMIPVMEHAEDVVRGVAASFELVATLGVTSFEAVATAIVSVIAPLGKLGHALVDLVTGNFTKLIADTKAANDAFTDTWKAGFEEIKSGWMEVESTFRGNTPVPPQFKESEAPTPGPITGGHDKAFQRDEQQLAEMRLQAAQSGYKLGIALEINFWKDRLAAAKKGSDEYREIVEKLASLEEEKLKMDRKPQPPSAFADVLRSTDVNQLGGATQAEAELAETQTAIRQELEVYREATEEKIRLGEESFRAFERDSQQEVQLGRETSRQRLQDVLEAAQKEMQAELQLIRAKEIVDSGNVVAYQKDLNQEAEITRKWASQIKEIHSQLTLQISAFWRQEVTKMTTEFNDAVAKWVVTGKGFQQSLAQIMAGVTEDVTKHILQQTEKWLLGIAMQKSGQKQSILGDAKTAAANAYSATSAIPVVGPFLAPPAAAAAFAAVMAFDSFAEGGVVRGPQRMHVPILAHAGERVLSASQTQNFETLVNSRTESRSSSSTINMGGVTNNFQGAQTSPRDFARAMNDAIRRGRLRIR